MKTIVSGLFHDLFVLVVSITTKWKLTFSYLLNLIDYERYDLTS
jgi:hypothetical protein